LLVAAAATLEAQKSEFDRPALQLVFKLLADEPAQVKAQINSH